MAGFHDLVGVGIAPVSKTTTIISFGNEGYFGVKQNNYDGFLKCK